MKTAFHTRWLLIILFVSLLGCTGNNGSPPATSAPGLEESPKPGIEGSPATVGPGGLIDVRTKRVRIASEMEQIAADSSKTAAEKILLLRTLFAKDIRWPAILYYMRQVDPVAGQREAIALFKKADTSRAHRLELGRFIVVRCDPGAFLDEYATFLVGAVLEGGEKEFFLKHEQGTQTAVGEYAFVASGFEGYKREQFEIMKDKRVIPILIRCLEAPDEVWPKEQGDLINGKSGDSTGRNTGRQNIPIALSRLEAIEATEALKRTMRTHHDYWLRYNSAYALGRILDGEKSKAVETDIGKVGGKDARQLFFPFGLGLIERGNDDGVQYLAFKYSTYADESKMSSVLYMMGQRLPCLKDMRSPKTEVFYRMVLAHPPLHALWLYDETKITFDSGPETRTQKLERSRGRILSNYRVVLNGLRMNKLTALRPLVEEIAAGTKNEEIRQISREYLDAKE